MYYAASLSFQYSTHFASIRASRFFLRFSRIIHLMSLPPLPNQRSISFFPFTGRTTTATLQQYPRDWRKTINPSLSLFPVSFNEAVIRSRMLSTRSVCFDWVSSLGSHIAAIAALCTHTSPLLHFSISSNSTPMTVSPNLWSAMATASRVRQRGLSAKRRNFSSTPLSPATSNFPSPSTSQKARNSAGELAEALCGSKKGNVQTKLRFPLPLLPALALHFLSVLADRIP